LPRSLEFYLAEVARPTPRRTAMAAWLSDHPMSSAITNSALSAGIRLRCRNSAYADSHEERTAAVKKQRLLFLYNNLHIFHHQRPARLWSASREYEFSIWRAAFSVCYRALAIERRVANRAVFDDYSQANWLTRSLSSRL